METHIEGTATKRYGATVATCREGKYLSFSLSGEDYGFPILKVKEIIGMMPITSVPGASKYIKGVVNLRGKVIPVVDLRLKFGFEVSGYTDRTCIIVVELQGQNGQLLMGNVVDSVSEVLNIKCGDIEDAPCFGARTDTDFILGMAKMGSSVKILLDIEKVLNSDEIVLLRDAA